MRLKGHMGFFFGKNARIIKKKRNFAPDLQNAS